MKNLNNVRLSYKREMRDNYMSFSDMAQDLTTKSLLELLPTLDTLKQQMVIMENLEKRGYHESNENEYFELLESCNGK
jgi:hypothetical protein